MALSVSFSFDLWQRLPDTVPLMMYLYFYNVTNWEDIQRDRNGTKPHLVEVGPYVYRQYQEMDCMTLNANKTVTYFQNKTWIFQEEASGERSLDDIITAINPIAVVSAEIDLTLQIVSNAVRFVLISSLSSRNGTYLTW